MSCYRVATWMQNIKARVFLRCGWPILAFVLIAFDASVNQVVNLIRSVGRARLIMVESQLRTNFAFMHLTVTTLVFVSAANFVQARMRHSHSQSKFFSRQRRVTFFQFRRLPAQSRFFLSQLLIPQSQVSQPCLRR